MTHFERTKFSPPIKLSISWSENFGWSSARRDAFFCTSYFLKYYYFGHIYIVLVRFFHILPIDGGYPILYPKIYIKQRCFIPEWGRGEGDFFFGLAFYRAHILYRDVTTFIIIVSWWQHHQTRLPMTNMFTNTCSLSTRYMVSMQ
jgi:hypothetical protein